METYRIYGIDEDNKSTVRRPLRLHIVNFNEFYCDGTLGLSVDECIEQWESESDDADWDDLPDLLIP